MTVSGEGLCETDDDVSARDRSKGSSPLLFILPILAILPSCLSCSSRQLKKQDGRIGRIETRPSQWRCTRASSAIQKSSSKQLPLSCPSALPTTETNIPTPETNHRLS